LEDDWLVQSTQSFVYTNFGAPTLAALPSLSTTTNVNWTVPLITSGGAPPRSVIATSSDTSVLRNDRIWAAPDASWIRIYPTAVGSTTVTVSFGDASGQSATRTFLLTVNARPSLPNPIPNTSTDSGTTGTVDVAVNAGTPPYTITATSSDQSVVADAGIVIQQAGTSASFQLKITPMTGRSGIVQITVTIKDNRTSIVVQTFSFGVNSIVDVSTGIKPPELQETFFGNYLNIIFLIGGAAIAVLLFTISVCICRRMYRDQQLTAKFDEQMEAAVPSSPHKAISSVSLDAAGASIELQNALHREENGDSPAP
jgi:hypothetical protein